jgi:acyl carrier protein
MKADLKQWFFCAGIIAMLVGGGVVIISGLAWYWTVAVFIIAFACFSIVGSKQETRRIETFLPDGRLLEKRNFREHYFPADRAEIAAKLRKILANHVGIDITKISPTDRFIEDLRMDDFDSMATVEYVIEIEKEFEIKIPDSAAEKMLTFQSVVDYVVEAVKSKTN